MPIIKINEEHFVDRIVKIVRDKNLKEGSSIEDLPIKHPEYWKTRLIQPMTGIELICTNSVNPKEENLPRALRTSIYGYELYIKGKVIKLSRESLYEDIKDAFWRNEPKQRIVFYNEEYRETYEYLGSLEKEEE